MIENTNIFKWIVGGILAVIFLGIVIWCIY